MDAALHAAPDPRRVYALSCTHGFDACAGRWWWCSRSEIGRLIGHGRALAVGARSSKVRRALTVEQESEVVAAVLELGGILYAATALAIPESMIRQIVRERGIAYPRASCRPADRAAARARLDAFVARRAA